MPDEPVTLANILADSADSKNAFPPPRLPPYWGQTQWRGPWGMLPLPQKDSPAAHSILDLIKYLSMLPLGRSTMGRDIAIGYRVPSDILGTPHAKGWMPYFSRQEGMQNAAQNPLAYDAARQAAPVASNVNEPFWRPMDQAMENVRLGRKPEGFWIGDRRFDSAREMNDAWALMGKEGPEAKAEAFRRLFQPVVGGKD